MGILDIRKNLSTDAGDIIEPPEMLGGMFPRGYVSIVASKPGVGKTWLTLSKAYTIGDMGNRVMILNGESGYSILQLRVQQLGYVFPETCTIYSLVDSVEYGGLMLTDATGWGNVNTIIEHDQPDIVFVDSLVAFCGCDESDMNTMRGVFARLSKLAQVRNCAVVLNHHLRKTLSDRKNGATQDDVIGSSIISRISCNMYTLTAEDDLVKVECVKSWFKKPAAFSFSLYGDDEGHVVVKASRPSEVMSWREILLNFMVIDKQWRTAPYLAKVIKAPRTTLHRLLKLLVESGHILKRVVPDNAPGMTPGRQSSFEYRYHMGETNVEQNKPSL